MDLALIWIFRLEALPLTEKRTMRCKRHVEEYFSEIQGVGSPDIYLKFQSDFLNIDKECF